MFEAYNQLATKVQRECTLLSKRSVIPDPVSDTSVALCYFQPSLQQSLGLDPSSRHPEMKLARANRTTERLRTVNNIDVLELAILKVLDELDPEESELVVIPPQLAHYYGAIASELAAISEVQGTK